MQVLDALGTENASVLIRLGHDFTHRSPRSMHMSNLWCIGGHQEKMQTVHSTATMPAQVNGRQGNTKRCKIGLSETRYPQSQVH